MFVSAYWASSGFSSFHWNCWAGYIFLLWNIVQECRQYTQQLLNSIKLASEKQHLIDYIHKCKQLNANEGKSERKKKFKAIILTNLSWYFCVVDVRSGRERMIKWRPIFHCLNVYMYMNFWSWICQTNEYKRCDDFKYIDHKWKYKTNKRNGNIWNRHNQARLEIY